MCVVCVCGVVFIVYCLLLVVYCLLLVLCYGALSVVVRCLTCLLVV